MVGVDVVVSGCGCGSDELHVEMKMNEEDNLVLDEQKLDKEQLKRMVGDMKKNKGKGRQKDADRMYHDDMVLRLFGKSVGEIVKEYNMMDGLNVLNTGLCGKENQDAHMLRELKLLVVLMSILMDHYFIRYEDNGYLNEICDEFEGYVIKMYYNNDRNAFEESINMKLFQCRDDRSKMMDDQKQNDDELQIFSKCLIKSLLRSFLYRVKIMESKNELSLMKIGKCILNWQLYALYGLRYKCELNEGLIEFKIDDDQRLNIQLQCIYDVILRKSYKYGVMIVLFLNLLKTKQEKLNKLDKDDVTTIIEKCGLYLQCNIDILYDIKEVDNNSKCNTYLKYTDLMSDHQKIIRILLSLFVN